VEHTAMSPASLTVCCNRSHSKRKSRI